MYRSVTPLHSCCGQWDLLQGLALRKVVKLENFHLQIHGLPIAYHTIVQVMDLVPSPSILPPPLITSLDKQNSSVL